jgi:ribonuclease HI
MGHAGVMSDVGGKVSGALRSVTSGSVPPAEPGETVVYTDGSCLGNPGPGGWAWAVANGPWASGAERRTTNQRMEVTAVLQALRSLPGPLLVVSDSTYVVHCFRDRWWQGWLRRGWRNASGQPVANRDLWEPLLALAVDDGRSVRFAWVRGHAGDPMNERVDQLATSAAASQQGASGDR